MAAKMNEILKANPGEKIFFAIGAAHWQLGSNSLEWLLKNKYGYSLEFLDSWEQDAFEDVPDHECRVVFDPEKGRFVTSEVSSTDATLPSQLDTSENIRWWSPATPREVNDTSSTEDGCDCNCDCDNTTNSTRGGRSLGLKGSIRGEVNALPDYESSSISMMIRSEVLFAVVYLSLLQLI